MKSGIAEQRRDYPTLRCTLLGWEQHISLHHTCFKPCANSSSHGREGVELIQESVMINAGETLGYVSIQDVFRLVADRQENCFDRIIAGPSRAETITVCFKWG